MRLKILLPFGVFAEYDDVRRIVAETLQGAYGLWPGRLDGVAALKPGILTFEPAGQGEVHLAVDEGVLVKAGREVYVSVRNAVGGVSLEQLHEAIEREFLDQDEQERNLRAVLAKLESGLVRRLLTYRHE